MSSGGDLVRRTRDRFVGPGARESGLLATTQLNLANAGCDALITVALASTVFFSVPTGEARGRVPLYLLITMVPFLFLAPVIGPLLDRFGRFRRVTLAVTLVVRGVLAWLMASHTGGIALYPLAFGSLVGSKAYGVARSAVVPRVVPRGASLVAVNSRLQLASTLGSTLLAPVAFGVTKAPGIGYTGLLRFAAIAYFAAALLVFHLPAHVDQPRQPGERTALPGIMLSRRRMVGDLPAGMRRMLPIRGLVGFLTIFLAFYLKSGHHGTLSLGVLALFVGVGNAAGLVLGRALQRRAPEVVITVAQLLSVAASIAAAAVFSLSVALSLALVTNVTATLAKLCIDAILQRDVPESRRASAIGVSETAYQLVWVLGGALGTIPAGGRVGFVTAAAVMGGLAVLSLRRPRPAADGGVLERPLAQAGNP